MAVIAQIGKEVWRVDPFSKDARVDDERIEGLQNRVYREAFILAMAVALVSIAVKWYVNGVDLELVITEMLVVGIPSLYYAVRIAFLGVYSDKAELHDRKSKVSMTAKGIILGLLSGVVIATLFGIRSAMLYGGDSSRVQYFLLVFLAALMIYLPVFVLGVALLDTAARRAGKRANPKDQE